LKANIKIIAEKSGVSIATVSRVLNDYKGVKDNTRKKVLKVVNDFDYEINAIAKSLKQKRTMTIGVIVGNILSQFYSIVAESVEMTLNKYGYNTILCNGNDNPEKELKYLKILRSNRVDGIILTPTGKNAGYINKLINSEIKIVLLDRLIDDVNCEAVIVDNLSGSYMAVRHLIEQGYKKIGIINGYINRTTGYDRLAGYKKALSDFNMGIDDNLIKIGDFKQDSGYKLTQEILKNKPDSLFVTNLDMTLGAILYLKEKRIRIPDNIAFVGFDDSEWAKIIDPPLTVVQQPVKVLAATAAEILIRSINENKIDQNSLIHTLNTNLVVRESSLKKNN
jgi:DNA-binding LacI/PurR family transcriptional regulator